MKRIGTLQIHKSNDKSNILTRSLYINNYGNLGCKIICTICTHDCEGHFVKLNEINNLGYKMVDDSIVVSGEIAY